MSSAERPEVPAGSSGDDPENVADGDIDDVGDLRLVGNFYRGLIVFLDRARGRGTIRSWSGREIHFEFPFVKIVSAPIGGRTPGINRIKQGDQVGFDVGWTAKGLRVTLIKPLVTP